MLLRTSVSRGGYSGWAKLLTHSGPSGGPRNDAPEIVRICPSGLSRPNAVNRKAAQLAAERLSSGIANATHGGIGTPLTSLEPELHATPRSRSSSGADRNSRSCFAFGLQ